MIHQVIAIAGSHRPGVTGAVGNGVIVLLLLDAKRSVILGLARPFHVRGIEEAVDIAVEAGVAGDFTFIFQRVRVDLEIAVFVLVDVRLDHLVQVRGEDAYRPSGKGRFRSGVRSGW